MTVDSRARIRGAPGTVTWKIHSQPMQYSGRNLFTTFGIPEHERNSHKKLCRRWQTTRRLCTPNSCRLVNDCDLLAGFCDFYLPLSQVTPSITSSYRIIRYEKTRMAGLQSGEGRMMIRLSRLDTIHQRDRHTDSHVAIVNVDRRTASGDENDVRLQYSSEQRSIRR